MSFLFCYMSLQSRGCVGVCSSRNMLPSRVPRAHINSYDLLWVLLHKYRPKSLKRHEEH